MIEIITLIIVIYLIYLFVVYVLPYLLAGGGLIALIILAVGAIVGFAVAIKNYFVAIVNNINFMEWEWKKGTEPAVRSYFFGPGYAQLKATIKEAFERNRKTIRDNSYRFFLYRLGLFICVYMLGTFITMFFAAIHGTITTVVMILTYVVFTVVWLIDQIYLLLHKIRSICPVCKRKILIPHFECPQCGSVHKKLVPGPYGIFNRTCTCGYRLPTTFFNGRSKLDSLCPYCSASLVASDARQIGIQLIGGSKAGKSVLLAALFHDFLAKVKKAGNLRVDITNEYQPYFDELERWYQGEDVPPTVQMSSQMYPILIEGSVGTKRQMSIYDIAGEAFDGDIAQTEALGAVFRHCDGLLFLVDPFSDGTLRADHISRGGGVDDFSNMKPDLVAENFINYLIDIGHAKANERCSIPMAVLIVKSDKKEVKRVIGPARLNALVRGGRYSQYGQARDEECRNFLNSIGLGFVVSLLETKFSNMHYFPVSAMGHSPDGDPYEPWGIMEVMDWMMPLIDSELSNAALLGK